MDTGPSWYERRLQARREGRDPRSVPKMVGDTRLWPYAVGLVLLVIAMRLLG